MTIKPSTKLLALLKSQQRNQPTESPEAEIKNLVEPKENIWGRSTAKKLLASKKARWWTQAFHRLLPPIPESEWNRLRDLAMNKMPLEKAPPRRSRPRGKIIEKDYSKIFAYLKDPIVMEQRERKEIKFDRSQGLTLKADNKAGDELSQRQLKRSLRRLYGSVWSCTPTMSQDEVTKEWNIKWGGGRTITHTGAITTPSVRDVELFEGLEDVPRRDIPPTEEEKQQQRESKRARRDKKREKILA